METFSTPVSLDSFGLDNMLPHPPPPPPQHQTTTTTSSSYSPPPDHSSLRDRVAAALRPFLATPHTAAYLLDTSPSNALHVLTSPSSLRSAVTSAHSETASSTAPPNLTLAFASEHLLLPQIALGPTFLGVAVSRHASIPSPSTPTPPPSDLRIGRFALAASTMLTLSHNLSTAQTYGLYLAPLSPSGARERLFFRVPTSSLLTIPTSLDFLSISIETPETPPSPPPHTPPLHPTDFSSFPARMLPFTGAHRGASFILRPADTSPPRPLQSSMDMHGFGPGGEMSATSATHARVAIALHASALRILGAPDRPVAAASDIFRAPHDHDHNNNNNNNNNNHNHLLHQTPHPKLPTGKFLPPVAAGRVVKGEDSFGRMPPELQRRTTRRYTPQEEAEREVRRTEKNRAAAARANARRKFVKTQLEIQERRVVELQDRKAQLLRERNVLRDRVSIIVRKGVIEGVRAA